MPTNLDPRIGTDAVSQRLDSLIFSSLVELDAQRIPRGDLAERWETPDAVTYVFHLRSGVKFHDGRPLTSADVKYTFDSILDRTVTSPKRGSLAMIRSIDAPDAATVIFHLQEPYAGFLWAIARPTVGIVPAGSGADFSERLTGSGPFRFVSANQDDNIVIERNGEYFGGAPNISRVQFRVVPDAIVRALELRKGSADVEVNSLGPDMIPVLRQQSTIDVTDTPGTNYQYIAFNLDDAALAKREVRQALAYATNREEIIQYLYRGQAHPADGPLPKSSWAYEPGIRRYEYDPQQAERLLDAAGFPRQPETGGMRVKLTLKTSTEESSRLLAAVLQEQWRKVGVDLDVRPLEFATLFSDMARGSFEIFTLRWIGANNDPDTFFDYIFDSRMIPPAGANRGHYRNPEIDALLGQARSRRAIGKSGVNCSARSRKSSRRICRTSVCGLWTTSACTGKESATCSFPRPGTMIFCAELMRGRNLGTPISRLAVWARQSGDWRSRGAAPKFRLPCHPRGRRGFPAR